MAQAARRIPLYAAYDGEGLQLTLLRGPDGPGLKETSSLEQPSRRHQGHQISENEKLLQGQQGDEWSALHNRIPWCRWAIFPVVVRCSQWMGSEVNVWQGQWILVLGESPQNHLLCLPEAKCPQGVLCLPKH